MTDRLFLVESDEDPMVEAAAREWAASSTAQADGLTPALPAQFQRLWPHQIPAIERTVSAFQAGEKLVVLDGPPGSGKTIVAEYVRRALGIKALYLTATKMLQAQIIRDLPYARLIMGRDNYRTLEDFTLTTASCDIWRKAGCRRKPSCGRGNETRLHCSWCHEVFDCPYLQAKVEAASAPLAVANLAYALLEWRGGKVFRDYPLVILDEWDAAESVILNTLTVRLTGSDLRRFGLTVPDTGIISTGWIDALRRVLRSVFEVDNPPDDQPKWTKILFQLEAVEAGLRDGSWVVLQADPQIGVEVGPISVEGLGREALWKYGQRWLCMSGTAIDPRLRLNDLGWTQRGKLVRVPSTYPVQNRPVRIWPVGSMTSKMRAQTMPKLIDAVRQILERHQGERVLIHSGTYGIAKQLESGLLAEGERLVVVGSARERDQCLGRFLQMPGGVLIGPAMERGLDLPDEACRVIVICRVPYAFQGDKRVEVRSKRPGWWTWQATETIAALVQMTMRGMRHKDDRVVSYVLDSQMNKLRASKLYRDRFPRYWLDACVDFNGW